MTSSVKVLISRHKLKDLRFHWNVKIDLRLEEKVL